MMMGGMFLWWIIPAAVVAATVWFVARRVTAKRIIPPVQPSGHRDPITDETRIYRLAMRQGGRLTVSDVVVQLGITAHEAENMLNGITDGTRVRMEVSNDGVVTYEFVELQREKTLPDQRREDV